MPAVKPSTIYTHVHAPRNLKYHQRQGWRVVGFRAPHRGENYLTSPSCTDINTSATIPPSGPRFIVVPKVPKPWLLSYQDTHAR